MSFSSSFTWSAISGRVQPYVLLKLSSLGLELKIMIVTHAISIKLNWIKNWFWQHPEMTTQAQSGHFRVLVGSNLILCDIVSGVDGVGQYGHSVNP